MVEERPKQKYPIGIQDFSELRERGFVYVDKTEFVYKLISEGKYYFLSRPRRFGKSLLLSTIEAFYQGRRELFAGLAIDSLVEKWDKHPVLHLDLNTEEYKNENSLKMFLSHQLSRWEEEYGICTDSKTSESIRFGEVIKAAYTRTGKNVVILIDEYDKPLLNARDKHEMAENYKSTLKAFYSNLKSMDRYIEFAMLTGVARFSKLSIFSDLNNLRDITFQKDYSAICGITETELNSYFKEGIQCLASDNEISYQDALAKLKELYDGYHFSEKSEDIYNPFSLVNVFASRSFDNYWFQSGTPTYLVRLLKQGEWNLRKISSYRIERNVLVSSGLLSGDLIPSLYQSGYLTIKGFDPIFDQYILDYPNREVKESFLKFLVPYYLDDKRNSDFDLRKFVMEVYEGKPHKFMNRLSSLISSMPYGGKGATPEDHYQNAMYLIFTLMGFYAEIEQHTAEGRIDLTVNTSDYIYIFEFKVDRSASEAMAQIYEKHYYKKYEASSKKIFLIGANFSTGSRSLDDCLIETVSE